MLLFTRWVYFQDGPDGACWELQSDFRNGVFATVLSDGTWTINSIHRRASSRGMVDPTEKLSERARVRQAMREAEASCITHRVL